MRALLLTVLLASCAPATSTEATDTQPIDTAADTAAGACSSPTSSEDARFQALLAELEAGLTADPQVSGPAGVGVAVVLDGALYAAGGVGVQAKDGQPRDDRAVGADTVFFIASTSKWITATAAMALVDEGLLDVHRPVVELLPDYTETNGRHADITAHHLLTMTSGLASDGGCWLYSHSASDVPDGCAAFTAGPGTVLEELFAPAVLASSPYDGSYGVYNLTSDTPGEAPYSYSNWGMMLAGRAMEVAAGAPFEQLVAERVFEPGCMQTAGYTAAEMTADDDYAIGGGPAAVDGYCPEPELGHDSVQPFMPDELACAARAPNGGVRASVLDLAHFAEALLADLDGAGVVVSSESAARMFCPEGGQPGGECMGRVDVDASLAGAYGDTYGYNNFLHTTGDHRVFTHGGGRAGFGALFWVVPESGFAVAMLGNDDGGSVDLQVAATFAVRCFLDGDC